MNDQKLLPCPFCKGIAEWRNISESHTQIRCTKCGITSPVGSGDWCDQVWNTRHSEPDEPRYDEEGKLITLFSDGFDRCDKMWRDRCKKQIDQLPDGSKVVIVPTNEGGWTEVDVTPYIIDVLESLLSDPTPTTKPTEVDGWIRVEDRLPEQVGIYLACWETGKIDTTNFGIKDKFDGMLSRSEKFVETSFWRYGNEGECDTYIQEYPTHWRYLPQPPKE